MQYGYIIGQIIVGIIVQAPALWLAGRFIVGSDRARQAVTGCRLHYCNKWEIKHAAIAGLDALVAVAVSGSLGEPAASGH